MTKRTACRILWQSMLLVACVPAVGCQLNVLALPYFLIAGEPKVDPAFKLVEKRKETKRVLVLAYADTGIRWGYQAIDDELTGLLVNQIQTADKRLEMVPDRSVREWKDRNADWVDKDPQMIGEHFDVDYVLFVEVTAFTLNTTQNQFLLQGHCDVLFKVWDVNKESLVFSNVFEKDYPSERSIELQDVTSEEQFRRLFLRRIAEELSWYVVPHRSADEIEDV
ncbi:hypothetical protein K2X85_17370 [bacterium]|nr:hypothetical protein [bacterium]